MLKLKNGNHCQKPIKTHQFSWRPDEYPAAPWPSSSLIHIAKFKRHILKPTCLNESKIDQVITFNCLILSCKRPVAKLSRSSFTWESRIKSWNSSKLSNSHRLILPLSPLPHPPVERCVHDSFSPLPSWANTSQSSRSHSTESEINSSTTSFEIHVKSCIYERLKTCQDTGDFAQAFRLDLPNQCRSPATLEAVRIASRKKLLDTSQRGPCFWNLSFYISLSCKDHKGGHEPIEHCWKLAQDATQSFGTSFQCLARSCWHRRIHWHRSRCLFVCTPLTFATETGKARTCHWHRRRWSASRITITFTTLKLHSEFNSSLKLVKTPWKI